MRLAIRLKFIAYKLITVYYNVKIGLFLLFSVLGFNPAVANVTERKEKPKVLSDGVEDHYAQINVRGGLGLPTYGNLTNLFTAGHQDSLRLQRRSSETSHAVCTWLPRVLVQLAVPTARVQQGPLVSLRRVL